MRKTIASHINQLFENMGGSCEFELPDGREKNVVKCYIKREPEGLTSRIKIALGKSFNVKKEIDFSNHQHVVLKNFVITSEGSIGTVYLHYIR